MATKFIADLHLYDVDSLEWRSELNMNLDQYATYLLENWNTFTDEDDLVIIAGDLGTYCTRTIEVLKRLKGKKILVRGNHDISWGGHAYDPSLFLGTHDYIMHNGIYITHIPEISESIREDVTYIVHGHHHRYDMPNMQIKLKQYARDIHRYNCAADLNNHKPCTLQELIVNKELILERAMDKGLL